MQISNSGERGFALVAVLFVMAIFFVLATVLLFQSRTEARRRVSTNKITWRRSGTQRRA